MTDYRDEVPLDLSALDPERDAERWRALLDATVRRANDAVSVRAETPVQLIASWSRPLLLAAAMLTALLVPVELVLERRETRTEQVRRLAQLSAARDGAPSGSDIVQALGARVLP